MLTVSLLRYSSWRREPQMEPVVGLGDRLACVEGQWRAKGKADR